MSGNPLPVGSPSDHEYENPLEDCTRDTHDWEWVFEDTNFELRVCIHCGVERVFLHEEGESPHDKNPIL